MSGRLDPFAEIDAIEALTEPTATDLARLDALEAGADSLVASFARIARRTITARVQDAARSAFLKSEGSSGQGGAEPAGAGSDPSLAEPYTDEPEGEGVRCTDPIAPTWGEGQGPTLAEGHAVAASPHPSGEEAKAPTPAESPARTALPSDLDQTITQQATSVASHVIGLDTMASGKFVSYLRVSTDRQGRSGLGLDAQRGAVADFLAGGRWTLVREFVEVESGKRADRPQLAEAMALCRVHGATLVIAKLDRLSRDAHFLLGLEKAGVDFVAADMPTANRLTVGIMAMVADEERRMISARTKAALAVAKARGTKLGGDRGNFALIAARGRAAGVAARRARASARTADLAPIIVGLQAEGVTSLAQLAAALTERGIPTSRGADRWSPMQVSRVLKAAANGT